MLLSVLKPIENIVRIRVGRSGRASANGRIERKPRRGSDRSKFGLYLLPIRDGCHLGFKSANFSSTIRTPVKFSGVSSVLSNGPRTLSFMKILTTGFGRNEPLFISTLR